MPLFTHNSVSIHCEVYGEGHPIILLHGAIVDFNYNYVQTGWVKTLTNAGFQVIGLNFRGYGESDKRYDPAFYGTTNLANDVVGLIHHLNLTDVAVMGYSLGSLIALDLIHKHSELFSKAVLIATGDGLIGKPPFILEKTLPGLAKLFAYESFPNHLPGHISAYWSFLHKLGLDKDAMVAFSQGSYPHLTAEEAATIAVPTLVVSGENDVVLGQGPIIAKALINGEYLEIKAADHFTLATNRNTHEGTIHFLTKGLWPTPPINEHMIPNTGTR